MRGTPLDKRLRELDTAELWAIHEAANETAREGPGSAWAAELRCFADRCWAARRVVLEEQERARRDAARVRYARKQGLLAARAPVRLPPMPEPDWDVAIVEVRL